MESHKLRLSASGGRLLAALAFLINIAVPFAASVGYETPALEKPSAPPTNLVAVPGNARVTLTWSPVATATSYRIYRTTTGTFSNTSIATVSSTTYINTGLVNGTAYSYRVVARNSKGDGPPSATVTATPFVAPPASAPANLVATPGDARVTLTWSSVATATSYQIFQTTTGTFSITPVATVTTTTYANTGLVNGTAHSYRVVALNGGGTGPVSAIVSATPVAPPMAPAAMSAVGGDQQVAISWPPVSVATAYRVYRARSSGGYSSTPTATVTATSNTYIDTGLENGPQYFYTVIATNGSGISPRSPEASAYAEASPYIPGPDTAAFRLLRHSTWGPRPGDIEHVRLVGHDAFIAEQFAAPVSEYPDVLLTPSTAEVQQQLLHLALTGPDQLRQRVAWALHKIWVVSAVEPSTAQGMVTYQRLLLRAAFANYRDLMKAVTLNPAMGRYLNMVNNWSHAASGAPPNQNYARELMQLFTVGTAMLSADGTTVTGPNHAPVPAYTQNDVAALARILTGWTYGDGDPATIPMGEAKVNYERPMEPVAAFHDAGAKTFLGEPFAAGASAAEDLDHALDVLFRHPNVGPFVAGQLITQLVTSNPSPAYVRDIGAVFNDNGGGVRGDLGAVVRAILLHPEASGPGSGKLTEPILFVTSLLRSTNAAVLDLRYLVERIADMGQNILYPPTVFSYFSPRFVVHGTALAGPEFQILTNLTTLDRANFVGLLVEGLAGDKALLDYDPFHARARDAALLVDHCNKLFMGGRMTAEERAEIIAAVRRFTIDLIGERVRTALYLTLVIAQVER